MHPARVSLVRRVGFAGAFLALLAHPSPASAQSGPAEPASPAAPPPETATPELAPAPAPQADDSAPPARRGFQMAISTGYSLPLGKFAAQGPAQSELFSGHVPFVFDIGGKLSEHVYVGGYFGVAFGAEGSGTSAQIQPSCNASRVGCTQVMLNIGAAVQYHFLPGGTVNPWVGYGIGAELTGLSVDASDAARTSVSGTGWDYGRFMVGVDFRLTRVIGLGPYIDYTVGKYGSVGTEIGNVRTSQSIDGTALHEWLTLGARVVFFP